MRPLLLAVAVAGCGGGVIQSADTPPPPPPGLAPLRLQCQPPDAEITLDDAYAGQLSGYRGGFVAVTPGPHRLRLSRSGCLPGYHDLVVPPEGLSIVTYLICPDPM